MNGKQGNKILIDQACTIDTLSQRYFDKFSVGLMVGGFSVQQLAGAT